MRRGRITLLNCDGVRLERQLARRVRTDLDAFGSSYAVRLIAPAADVEALERGLAQRLGKRRATLLRIESAIQMLQRLRGDAIALTPRVKQTVIDAIAKFSPLLRSAIEQTQDLDRLVAERPDDPLALAYVSGISSFGVEHPYECLDRFDLPVDLQSLYVVGFGELPATVQRWLLAGVRRNVQIVLSGIRSEDLLPLLPDNIDVCNVGTPEKQGCDINESHLAFDAVDGERQAILDACEANDVDTVFCASRSAQSQLEIDCLLRRIPYRAPPMSSVITSESINALVAYLEWTVYESDSGLFTLLNMMGVSEKSYYQFAKAYKLPQQLSVAALVLPRDADPDTRIYRTLKELAELIFDSRMSSSAYGRLCYFAEWGERNIPEFDREILQLLLARSGIADSAMSLADLKDSLYAAIPNGADNCVTIASPVALEGAKCVRAWLALGLTEERLTDRLIAAVLPHVQQSLTVSSVQSEQAA